MLLNKKVQYGILFCLYLARAGRATTRSASESLNLSKSFLDQVARKLRLSGIVTSTRGPGGGYQLNKEATLFDIISHLTDTFVLTLDEKETYRQGQPEERALYQLATNLNYGLQHMLNRKVNNLMLELVANEVKTLDKLNESGLEN